MQLLVRQIGNKTTAPCIWGNKLIFGILLLLYVHVSSVTTERTCHQCRGINCLRTTYVATQKCLNDLDICVTVFDGQTVLAQGCLEQLSDELRNKCSGDSKELRECLKCNGNLCNNLASSSFKCIQCDSDSDENCRTNPLNLAPSRCGISRTPNEYCYVKREGNRVIRGCSNTLAEQKSCLSSANCMICQPSELTNCNADEVTNDDSSSGDDNNSNGGNSGDGGSESGRICHQCSGINCLRTTYESTQKCLNDLDICVTVFDGETIRAQGCLEQLSEELRNKCGNEANNQDNKGLSECFKCSGNLCNNLASSSFECIQCDSDNDENCRTNPQSLVPTRCGISRTPNEYCFVKQEGERVVRGCAKTLQEQKSCLSSTDCMICQPSQLSGCNDSELTTDDSGSGGSEDGGSGNGSDGGNTGGDGSGAGSDGGNTGDGDTESERICHQCSGINCLRTTYESTQKCLNDLDICVTVFDGETIQAQGCLEQLPEELRNKCGDEAKIQDSKELSDCYKCNENLCNNLASSSFECIQCDSESDENCRTNPQSLVPTRCGISRTPNEYCFVRQEDKRVIRGCAKTLEEQKSCLSSADCMICQPSQLSGCNDSEVTTDDSGTGGSGDGGSGSGSDGGNTGGDGSGSGSDGGNTGDGGSGSGSDGGNTGDGGSGSGSDGGNTGDSGTGSDGDNTGNDGAGSGSDGGITGDGGSGSGAGDGSGSGDGNNGSGDGSGDIPGSNGSNILNSHIFTFVLNAIIVFYISRQ